MVAWLISVYGMLNIFHVSTHICDRENLRVGAGLARLNNWLSRKLSRDRRFVENKNQAHGLAFYPHF